MRFVSLRVSVLPLATAPASVVALPSSIFCAPTMSAEHRAPHGDSIAGSRMRSSACAKARAVTREPSEKRASFRIGERVGPAPSRDRLGSASASSGCSRPALGKRLGRVVHQAAARRGQEVSIPGASERGVDRRDASGRHRRPGTCRPP